MEEEILNNIENAAELERIYRSSPVEFSEAFNLIYESIKEHPTAEFWNIRLKSEHLSTEGEEIIVNEASPKTKFNFVYTIIAALTAGTLVKVPSFLGITKDDYMINNFAFFV